MKRLIRLSKVVAGLFMGWILFFCCLFYVGAHTGVL